MLKAESREEKEVPITCAKCGQTYDKPSEAFYWEPRKNNYRKPCKKCLSEYNKTPGQKKRRYEYLVEYRKALKIKKTQCGTKRRSPQSPRPTP